MLEQPDIVYIDHLDLLEGKPQRDSKMDWYNFCTRFLRQNVAKGKNHIPVVLLHQLSRGASREKRRPTKHDLAYAGENDADAIYLLHRPDEDIVSKVIDIEIITAKSRFGWTGTELARFHLTKQQFFAPAGYTREPAESESEGIDE
jgi:replicative DNA helicase